MDWLDIKLAADDWLRWLSPSIFTKLFLAGLSGLVSLEWKQKYYWQLSLDPDVNSYYDIYIGCVVVASIFLIVALLDLYKILKFPGEYEHLYRYVKE